jgi:hypothetical protein
MRAVLLAFGLSLLCALPAAAAPQVVCRYTYGGETRELIAPPVASPYGVDSIAVGSYFRLRVVFQDRPADLASIKIYTYADRDDGPVPIHQATYAYPPMDAGAGFGFSGRQFVYEPVRDGELEYWCRLQGEAGRAR